MSPLAYLPALFILFSLESVPFSLCVWFWSDSAEALAWEMMLSVSSRVLSRPSDSFDTCWSLLFLTPPDLDAADWALPAPSKSCMALHWVLNNFLSWLNSCYRSLNWALNLMPWLISICFCLGSTLFWVLVSSSSVSVSESMPFEMDLVYSIMSLATIFLVIWGLFGYFSGSEECPWFCGLCCIRLWRRSTLSPNYFRFYLVSFYFFWNLDLKKSKVAMKGFSLASGFCLS